MTYAHKISFKENTLVVHSTSVFPIPGFFLGIDKLLDVTDQSEQYNITHIMDTKKVLLVLKDRSIAQ